MVRQLKKHIYRISLPNYSVRIILKQIIMKSKNPLTPAVLIDDHFDPGVPIIFIHFPCK